LGTEILYCARCHRVILPREIQEGNYHFVDGESVCRECFKRLSRRLRPVSGAPEADKAQPIPVNLSDLEKELSKGTSGTEAPRMISKRERFSSGRHAAQRGDKTAHAAFMAGCFVVGVLLGAVAYKTWPLDRPPQRTAPPAPPTPDGDGGTSRDSGSPGESTAPTSP
jgi:hypothetical protein